MSVDSPSRKVRTCTAKQNYYSEDEATKRAAKLGSEFSAYKCIYADHWHLTTMGKKK